VLLLARGLSSMPAARALSENERLNLPSTVLAYGTSLACTPCSLAAPLASPIECPLVHSGTKREDYEYARACEERGTQCESRYNTTSLTPNVAEEPDGCTETKDDPGYDWVCSFIRVDSAGREVDNYLVNQEPSGCWTARGEAPIRWKDIATGCLLNTENRQVVEREEARGREEEQQHEERNTQSEEQNKEEGDEEG
jgi:hypothetical protein